MLVEVLFVFIFSTLSMNTTSTNIHSATHNYMITSDHINLPNRELIVKAILKSILYSYSSLLGTYSSEWQFISPLGLIHFNLLLKLLLRIILSVIRITIINRSQLTSIPINKLKITESICKSKSKLIIITFNSLNTKIKLITNITTIINITQTTIINTINTTCTTIINIVCKLLNECLTNIEMSINLTSNFNYKHDIL